MVGAKQQDALPIDQRQAILQEKIAWYTAKGFHPESNTGLSAYLIRPKKFDWVWAILSILSGGIGLLFYLLKGDDEVYLEVLPDGRISHSPTIDHGQSRWCPVPAKRVEVLDISDKRARDVHVSGVRLDRYGVNALLNCADDRVWKCRYPGQTKPYLFPESRLRRLRQRGQWKTIMWQCQKCGHTWFGKSPESRTVRVWCRKCGSRNVYPGTKDLTWDEVAHRIRQRDGFRCQGCGAEHVPLQVHHLISLHRGGSNHPSNLVTLCQRCHSKWHPHLTAVGRRW